MKRRFALIVLIICTISMSGCTSDKENNQPSKVTQSTASITTESSQIEDLPVENRGSIVKIYCDVGREDLEGRTACYADFNKFYEGIQEKGMSYCNTLSSATWHKGGCIQLLAMYERNESVCNQISAQDASSDVRIQEANYCISMVALVKQEISLCEHVSLRGKESKWSKPTDDKDICIMRVAEAKKDASLCNRITFALFKDSCIEGVAEAKKTG